MSSRRLLCVVALSLSLSPTIAESDPISGAADAPQPMSPEASLAAMRVPDGMRVELVACEPLVREPSGVCWDERGRLFVCELHGYNLEGHYDVEQLNKTGKLDREVRRIQASDEAKRKAEAETTGTVKRLIDTDGDGCMDRAEVWADDLPPCYGLVAARGGLIAACAPHIVYLADRDDDGRAEVRETLFTGFAAGILERRLNAPQWGLDGWIYFGAGQGGTITGPRLKQPVQLPRSDLRIRADGSAIEPVEGITWGLGFGFTAADERLVSSIGWPATAIVPLPWRYLARNPYLASPPLNDANPSDRRTYPISRPHPWRTKRAADPGFNRFYTERYGVAESAPNGYFTSCCAPLVYLDSLLPGLHGHLLVCEPAQNLLARMRLEHVGARLDIRRVETERRSEFLSSTDQWFHPIALAHAPDGSVVIADFYREIIEDYSAIPRYLQQQYDLTAGREHGRLWRLTAADGASASTDAATADMSRLSAEELAAEIASPRAWRRRTAHRLLVECAATEAAPALERHVREADDVSVVLHALHALDQLGRLSPETVRAALGSRRPDVRIHALRLAESLLDCEATVRESAFALVDDPDPRVRLQLALSLGESRHGEVVKLLARLAPNADREPWLATAIASSVADRAGPLIAAMLAMRTPGRKPADTAPELFAVLARLAAVRRDDEQIERLLEIVAALDGAADQPLRLRLLDGLVSGLKEGSPRTSTTETERKAIERLLADGAAATSAAALQLAGLLRVTESPAMRTAWNAMLATAMNDAESGERRLAAIALLGSAPFAHGESMARLLDVRQPNDVQLAVVKALSAATDPKVVEVLTKNFAALSPDVRAAIVEAVCSRSDRLPGLLDQLERRVISPGDLPTLHRARLLEHSDEALRARAALVLVAESSAERRALFERYRAALAGPRDPAAGRPIFEKHCAKCHQLGKDGFAVGPDLDSVRLRPDESLLPDVLEPSGAINPKYPAYTVVTTAGRIATGILAGESATSITLRREKNETVTILRRDVDELTAARKSLMPEGMEREISPRQMADLFAYLRSTLGLEGTAK